MDISVVICTHDRASLLLRALRHLDAARRPLGCDAAILVVANACTDDTVKMLAGYRSENPDGLPLSWIEEPVPGKSNALNLAIPLLESDLVAFVDDDHRVDIDYLANACAAAERYPDAGLFCGRILPDWDGTEPSWVHDRGPYRIYPLPIPRFDLGDAPMALDLQTAIPGGGNLFLRREWLTQVGEFSPALGPTGHDLGGAEDLEWLKRALAAGARLRYVPDVVQYHYVDQARLALPYLMKKAYKRSISTVRLSADFASGVPLFMYRKLARYLFLALTAWSRSRRRFYLVRLAAALGETRGLRKAGAEESWMLSGRRHRRA